MPELSGLRLKLVAVYTIVCLIWSGYVASGGQQAAHQRIGDLIQSA
jgi:hypothetical protein